MTMRYQSSQPNFKISKTNYSFTSHIGPHGSSTALSQSAWYQLTLTEHGYGTSVCHIPQRWSSWVRLGAYWLIKYQDGDCVNATPTRERSPIPVLTGPNVEKSKDIARDQGASTTPNRHRTSKYNVIVSTVNVAESRLLDKRNDKTDTRKCCRHLENSLTNY